MSKKFIFRKSLVEDVPTDYGQKHLDELFLYIREQRGGLKVLHFWSYRLDGIQCFAVDMRGINNKYCCLNIGVTHISRWESMSHSIDVDVVDGIDAVSIV